MALCLATRRLCRYGNVLPPTAAVQVFACSLTAAMTDDNKLSPTTESASCSWKMVIGNAILATAGIAKLPPVVKCDQGCWATSVLQSS